MLQEPGNWSENRGYDAHDWVVELVETPFQDARLLEVLFGTTTEGERILRFLGQVFINH